MTSYWPSTRSRPTRSCTRARVEEPGAPGGRIPRARDGSECREPDGTETGRGLWLAAQLADELSITSGPDSTIVSLYIRFD
jgi:anti-sigma regulatory factor (Ser/Thr protein kinase)